MNTHPAVVRSAVIGRTVSSEGGEEIIAFVELANSVKNHCGGTGRAFRSSSGRIQTPVSDLYCAGHAADPRPARSSRINWRNYWTTRLQQDRGTRTALRAELQ